MIIPINSMKKKLLLLPLIAGLFYLTLSSNSSSPGASASAINGTGATGVTGCSGSACHSSGATTTDSVAVYLDSAGTLVDHYVAGRSYNIVLIGKNLSSTSLPRFGFQLTAVYNAIFTSSWHYAGTGGALNAGTLATSGLPSGTATHAIFAGSFLLTEHSAGSLAATSGSGGAGTIYRMVIPWTAPTAIGSGTVALYGVINMVNGSGGADAGDKWNNDSTQIHEYIPPVARILGPSSVCVGANITLTDSTTGGTWGSLSPSIASITTAGVVRGNAAGTAVITYSTPYSGTAYDTITVNGPPSAGTISGASQICISTSTTLSTTVTGGTWSSSAPGIVSINASTGAAYGVALGTATISYSKTGACGTGISTYRDTVVNTVSAGSISGPSSICPGATGTMVRTSGGGGGTWSSSNTAIATINPTTGIVYGVSPGTVTISYSLGSACGSFTVTTSLTISTFPPAIVGPTAVCVNSAVTLTDSVPSGLWSSSNSAIAIAAAGLGTVTGVAAGTVTITYTPPSGCATFRTMTVNRIPAPITGTFNVCPGATRVLSDTSIGGVWSSSDTFKAKLTGPGAVKGVNAGSATISYTFPSTGCYVTGAMTVNPAPPFIVGSAAFCATTDDSLSNYMAGGAWTATPSSVASISPTGVLHGVSGGTVTVTYTLPTGCSVSRSLVVHPLPVPVITFNWYTNTFSVPTYYVSYQWYENGVAVTGATINTFSAALNGTYNVHVKDSFGCENDAANYIITNLAVNSVSMEGQIKVGPNPASTILNIEAPVSLRAVISSVDGRIVKDEKNVKSVDISNLVDGIYMVSLFDESGSRVAIRKFIKQ